MNNSYFLIRFDSSVENKSQFKDKITSLVLNRESFIVMNAISKNAPSQMKYPMMVYI